MEGLIWTHAGIIPAYAGLTQEVEAMADLAEDHPRLRGVNGAAEIGGARGRGSSPLTRG